MAYTFYPIPTCPLDELTGKFLAKIGDRKAYPVSDVLIEFSRPVYRDEILAGLLIRADEDGPPITGRIDGFWRVRSYLEKRLAALERVGDAFDMTAEVASFVTRRYFDCMGKLSFDSIAALRYVIETFGVDVSALCGENGDSLARFMDRTRGVPSDPDHADMLSGSPLLKLLKNK